MSWDSIPGKNSEGYPDPTAATALAHVQRSQRGRQSRIMGDHFENMITASLRWYEDKGVACVEKTPEPMKPLRAPNRQGQFLACYVKAGQPDFKGTLTARPRGLRLPTLYCRRSKPADQRQETRAHHDRLRGAGAAHYCDQYDILGGTHLWHTNRRSSPVQ